MLRTIHCLQRRDDGWRHIHPINTAVGPVLRVMLHHGTAGTAGGPCELRMAGFGGKGSSVTIRIYWYIKYVGLPWCQTTSFLFLGLCAPCHWQGSLLQQHVTMLTLLFVVSDSNSATAEQNYFSPTSVSTSTSVKLRFFAFLSPPAILSDKTQYFHLSLFYMQIAFMRLFALTIYG